MSCNRIAQEDQYLITQQAQSDVEDSDFRSKQARDEMENIQQDTMAILNVIGGT
jgi:hypothetical protein